MAVHRKATPLMEPMEAMARLAARAQSRAESAQTRSSGSASYDNGDGTRTVIGPQTGSATMATHVGDVTPPGRPLGVAGASSAGVVYVAWGGELDGGIPADFGHVSLYMSVEGASELVGTLTEAGIVSTVPMATTATVEVWATAEDDACLADGTPAHNISSESDHATVKVTQAEDKAAVDALRDRLSKVEATADGLTTLIREGEDGITVGKSSDGKTWSTTRTRMGALAFEVLTKAGEVASSFGEKVIELGKNSQDAVIRMLGGLVTIKATSAGVSDGAWCEISTDEFVSTNGYHASRIAAGYKDETGFIPQGVAEVMVEGGEGNGGVLMYAGAHGSEGNSFAMSPEAYTINHPEYILSALGLGAAATYQAATTDPTLTYDSTTVLRWGRVCAMPFSVHYTSDWAPSEYAFFTLPEAVRPSVEQHATVTSCPYNWASDYRPTLVSIGTDGKIKLSGPAAGHWIGQLVWVV